ncbi:MAG: virulence RhuM family protein [Proteobacteria bacterium]|nr:virulence RhuM family protein [Pseudomonadota bacterium]
MKELLSTSKEKNIVLYGNIDDGPVVAVVVENETLWLTQKQMAELFNCSSDNISLHLKNIFNEGELDPISTTEESSVVQTEGTRRISRTVKYYNLDAIIAVGYRVNSKQATHFRQWATQVLKEYIIKGFALDDERLKQAKTVLGKDYFQELLERVRSIRASEQRIWLQVTEIFRECSIDYDSHSLEARRFFATVQNRFHFAINNQTAAEIIHSRADHTKPHMGLKTWSNSPEGRVNKSDTTIAKNYLDEKELKSLERSVNSYFDYIEGQIERKKKFSMLELRQSVDKFLAFNDLPVLEGNGQVSKKQAEEKAHKEYEIFNKTQPIGRDFKKFLNEVKKLKK